MKISVVVPVYNESPGLEEFMKSLKSTMDSLKMHWDVLFVDDGSEDDSWQIIQRLTNLHPVARGIQLSRNFGHQIALSAGLEHADGDAVITMDADLQHPPQLIPALVAKWQEGWEVVNTIRSDSRATGWFKRRTSTLFYRFINKISDVPITAGAADFRLLDRKAITALLSMPERNRFLRGMVSWIGFRQTFVCYEPGTRSAGESKYTLKKMLHLGIDGLTSFSLGPLRLALLLGAVSIVLALFYAIYVLWVKIATHTAEPGWTSIIGVVLFFGGVQLVSLGIFGEYLGQIFGETKHRPLYIIRQTAGPIPHPVRKENL